MKNALFSLAVLGIAIGFFSFKDIAQPAPPPPVEAIKWMTWQEATEKSKTQKKKILVDVYTDWCGWCKRMDAATFQQAHISNYVNAHFYAVKFNAEMKEDIEFNGKTYKFVKNGMRGYHELAAEITRGRLSYPTVVFLDEKLEVIQPVPGYKDALEFEQIITYFAKDEHKKTPWEKYQKEYKPMKKD